MFRARPEKPAPLFPDVVLNSDRLLIRPPHPDDWRPWAELRSRSRDHLVPFEPEWAENSLTESLFSRRLAQQAKGWRDGLSCSFLIFLQDGGPVIGGINLNNICRGAAQYASLGYWLGQEFQGHGYMFEAARRILHFGYEDIRLHRVNAAAIPHNGRSIKMLRRLGFQEEGFAKAYLQINSEWQDHILFGMNVEDFILKYGEIMA